MLVYLHIQTTSFVLQVQQLFQAEVPERITTGHRSLESLCTYEHNSNDQQQAVCECIEFITYPCKTIAGNISNIKGIYHSRREYIRFIFPPASLMFGSSRIYTVNIILYIYIYIYIYCTLDRNHMLGSTISEIQHCWCL